MSNEDVVIADRKDSVASSAAAAAAAAAGGDGSVDIISSTTALFHDALEDVHTRFVLNLPESELQTADRIFFQLEQAWWFYEDWICDPDPNCSLPRFASFKPFAQQLFQYSPLLDETQFPKMWNEFSLYKRKISNYGCILLNQDGDQVVLCVLWNSKTHTFPAGKINQGETGLQAAARECYEETGFDPLCQLGLTATMVPSEVSWKPLREQDALTFQEENGKRRICYVCAGVPEDFPFEPVSRKEVQTIGWHALDNLPKPNYAVIPFISQLKKWIRNNNNTKGGNKTTSTPARDTSRSHNNRAHRNSSSRDSSRNNSRARTRSSGSIREARESDDIVTSGLANAGDMSGWSEEDMFAVNAKLLGRSIEYDGNPHVFAEQGFGGGNDPHAFHVVGGRFLNSQGDDGSLAPPETSKLQPLFLRPSDGDDNAEEKELTPFFSGDGITPWGEVVPEALSSSLPVAKAAAAAAAAPTLESGKPNRREGEPWIQSLQSKSKTFVDDSTFLTDTEITARSQATKNRSTTNHARMQQQQQQLQYEQDMEFVRQWVAHLPKPPPSKYFGEVKLDADAIVQIATAHWNNS